MSRHKTSHIRKTLSAVYLLPLVLICPGTRVSAQITLSYDNVLELIEARPEVVRLVQTPPAPVTLVRVLGARPDLVLGKDGRTVVPALNVEVLLRAKVKHTAYGVLSLKYGLVQRNGQLTLEPIPPVCFVDLRVNDRKSISNLGFPGGDRLRDALSSSQGIGGLLQAITTGVSVREARLTPRGIELQLASSDEDVGELRVLHNLGPGDLNHRQINYAVGNPAEAALIVDLFDGHLNYYQAYVLHVRLNGRIEGMGDHSDSRDQLLSSGLADIEGRLHPRPNPGKNLVTLYLKPGEALPNLNRKDLKGWAPGFHWNDRIGSIRVRPGPAYGGELLAVFEHPDFKGRSEHLPVGDYALATTQYAALFGEISSFQVGQKR